MPEPGAAAASGSKFIARLYVPKAFPIARVRAARVFLIPMKYALIIAGGGGEPIGTPIPDLEGFTPLEAARTPMLDALGETGRQGVVRTTPEGATSGAHAPVCSLLGVDMRGWAPSRAGLEALGLSAEVGSDATVWRLVPVTMDADFATIADPYPAFVTSADTRALVESLRGAMSAHGELSRVRVVDGAGALGNEALLILDDASEESRAGKHAMPGADEMFGGGGGSGGGRALVKAFPKGAVGQMLRAVCELSADVFQNHPVNMLRAEHDLGAVSMFWAEGGGALPVVQTGLGEMFDVRAAVVTGDAACAGAAHLLGIDRLPVPGELVGARADFGTMASAAIGALERYDLVIVHTDAMSAASLAGDWRAKSAIWERIDEELVVPIHARLLAEGDAEADADQEGWRLMVACDSVCSCAQRLRAVDASPFVMAGAFVRSVLNAPFGDTNAHGSDLKIDPGHTLMEYFLYSGLRVSRRRGGAGVGTKQWEG